MDPTGGKFHTFLWFFSSILRPVVAARVHVHVRVLLICSCLYVFTKQAKSNLLATCLHRQTDRECETAATCHQETILLAQRPWEPIESRYLLNIKLYSTGLQRSMVGTYSSLRSLAAALVLLSLSTTAICQNIDTAQPILRQVPGLDNDAYFGYTLVLHQTANNPNGMAEAINGAR